MGTSSGQTAGRRHELGELLRLARSVIERPDRVVLVSGEAGIGKTHLAREALERLAADGFRVAWGRADPVERAVPYAAIGQVLASLGSATGPHSDDTSATAGPDAVLLEVYKPVSERLEAACADDPVIVVIDDLHYADEDTLLLLGFLVRRLVNLPVAWLFTARSHLPEPVPTLDRLLNGLREDGRLDEMVLDPLPEDDIARLVEQVVGHALEPAVREAVTARAAGNPFFAIQLGLALDDAVRSGGGEAPNPATTVPGVSRRVALLERVFPLGENARAVARLASVYGDVDVDRLEGFTAVLGLEIDQIQDGFDRLVRADLLRAARSGHYEFVHDLVRETLYADLGPGERRRLHGAAARAMLELRSRGAAVDIVELARHLSLSSIGPDARAADVLREAGDALVGSSPHSAVTRYRQALEHLPDGSSRSSDPGDAVRVVEAYDVGESELYVRLARALHRAGTPEDVVAVCRRGLESAKGRARDRLTRYLAGALADTGSFGDALHVVDHELVDRGPSPVLLTTRALLLRLLEDFGGAAAAIEQAAATARTPPERLAVLFQRLNLAVDVGSVADPQDTVAQVERLVPSLDPERRLMAHAHIAGACGGFGDMQRSADHLAAVDALESQGVLNVDWPWSWSAQITLDLRRGRWDDAVRSYERSAGDFGVGLRRLARNHAIFGLTDVTVYRGDAELGRRLASDVTEVSASGRRVQAAVHAAIDRAEDRPADAVARLEEAVADVPASSQQALWLVVQLIEAHRANGTTDDSLLDRARALTRAQDTPNAWIILDLVEAQLCDDVDAASAGLALGAEHGIVVYEAPLRLELGRLGIDPEHNLVAAHELVRAMNASALLAHVEAEMRRQGVRVPSRRRRDRYALTDAEQRVAELVGGGLTNKAIAARLAYSVKTIEAYLSRVYAKTGSSNRVELARHLAALGDAGTNPGPSPSLKKMRG